MSVFVLKKSYFIHSLLLSLFLLVFLAVSGCSRRQLLTDAEGSTDSRINTCAETFSDFILLWKEACPAENAASYLAEFYPSLILAEHDGDYSLCHLSAPSDASALLATLSKDTHFRAAEPDYPMGLMSLPDDPYLNAQWALQNNGTYTRYYGSTPITQDSLSGIDMNFLRAWDAYPLPSEETRPVIVAIIDTGVDFRHPDLAGHLWINSAEIDGNGIDDDGNGFIDDIYGWDFYHNDPSVCHYIETEDGYTAQPEDNDSHGTHCAGIIAAAADNGIGIAGAASNINVQIMSLKIHGGTSSAGSISNAIKAIRYAEAMGANICNLSWGTTNYSQALELVIRESSMLFVTAAGNSGANNNSTPIYPASFRLPNLISVAFIDANGNLSKNSNYGLSTVDIAAPGEDIYSTTIGGYGYLSGSSMAAPYVTALAAMIYAYRDDIYPSQVKELIVNTMQPLSSLDGYLIHAGIPNALLAVQSLDTLTSDTQAPVMSLSTSYQQDLICVLIFPFDAGNSGVRRIKYAYGSKPAEFFFIEGNGNSVTDDFILLTKAGFYTFFIEDYAGNYTSYNYYVEDDKIAPVITADYAVVPDAPVFSFTVSAEDVQSGLKTLKYLTGEHSAADFLSDGTSLVAMNSIFSDTASSPVDMPLSFELPVDDATAVTFYASDYRGNCSLYTIYPKIVPASSLHLNVLERSLDVYQTFHLQAIAFPFNTTDLVTFSTTDETVLSVSEDGIVTAIQPGEASIFATTSSGVQRACQLTVRAPKNQPSEEGSPANVTSDQPASNETNESEEDTAKNTAQDSAGNNAENTDENSIENNTADTDKNTTENNVADTDRNATENSSSDVNENANATENNTADTDKNTTENNAADTNENITENIAMNTEGNACY